jgi:hypothetical protein
MKKNSILITLLLIACTSATFGMEPENKNGNKGWLAFVTAVLLHGIKPFEQFLSQDPNFEYLPVEEQAETLLFLTRNNNASTLESAAAAINSLAKVNKQLDTLINKPLFCFKLIKRFAQRFKCSDETAAQALQTKEAKHRLSIQETFKTLFAQWDFDVEEFEGLYDQYKNYVDLNFTYQHSNHIRYDDKSTLLINSAMHESPYKTVKIESLLATNRVNINYQNAYNETALIACAYTNDNPTVLQLLCKSPNIHINLQDNHGNTALMATCLSKKNKNLQSACIFILLYEGANPEIANNKGKTPLDIHKEVKSLQDAIQKRRDARIQENIDAEKQTTKQKKK